MLAIALVASAVVAADPAAERHELLKTFRDEFVAITPGQGDFPAAFTMGNAAGPAAEQPTHRVTLGRPFAMARYEVPQNLWRAVMGANSSRWKGERNSVEMLSYDDAFAFCRKATELMRADNLIKANESIRLPSEAEWEYAARAGTQTRFSFGDDDRELTHYAWFTGNAAGNDPAVGAKRPNLWKLYDVHGYLWEWCADPWHENYDNAPADGSVWSAGDAQKRVLRGGSWKDPAERTTSSSRRGEAHDFKDDAVGLRCVLAVEQ
jgi:formylglycine-generating enzyme required for sulfatase activity